MNTVAKGDAFEDRAYNVFSSLLSTGDLGVDSRRTIVSRKKKYHSDAQGSYITFDISIETYMPNSSVPSFVILIECKDYKTPINVHKIRNFYGQIQEAGGHKGYFITSSKFQQGSISFAATHRIGLITMNIDDDIKWIVRRSSSENLSLCNDNDMPFLATIDNKIFTNIIDFLSYENLKVNFNYSSLKIDYLADAIITEKVADSILSSSYANRLLLAYQSKSEIEKALNKGDNLNYLASFKLQSQEIIDILKEKYNIEVVQNYSLNENELGRLNISNRTIYLSEKLVSESHRWRFTLAHEFAHVVLHEELLTNGNIYIVSDEDTMDDPFLRLSSMSMPSSIKRMEIQANFFASSLLMPIIPMLVEFINIKKTLGIAQSYIRLDDQPINLKNFNIIVSRISERFGVSLQVVKYKMYKLELIKDYSRTQRLRDSFDGLSL